MSAQRRTPQATAFSDAELGGAAEAVEGPPALIRIHPGRIVSCGLGGGAG